MSKPTSCVIAVGNILPDSITTLILYLSFVIGDPRRGVDLIAIIYGRKYTNKNTFFRTIYAYNTENNYLLQH